MTTLEKEPPHPILYDPAKPRRALLLTSLVPPPVVSEGGWTAPVGAGVFARLATVVAAPVAGPLIGWWYVFS